MSRRGLANAIASGRIFLARARMDIGKQSLKRRFWFQVLLVSLVVSIFVIRLMANAFIIAAFLLAIIVSPAWLYVQRSQGLDVDQGLLFIGSALFAFRSTLHSASLANVNNHAMDRQKRG